MRRMIDKLFFVLFVIFRRIFFTHKVSKKDRCDILLWNMQSGLGDKILILDVLNALSDVVANRNINVCMVADHSTIDMIKQFGLKFNFEYIECCDKDKFYKWSNFKRLVTTLSKIDWDYVISFNYIGGGALLCNSALSYAKLLTPNSKAREVTFGNRLGECLVHDNEYVYVEGCGEAWPHSKIVFEKVFRRLCFYLGVDYRGDLKRCCIPEKNLSNHFTDRYCVIAPGFGANNPHPFRGWPAERYAKVVQWLISYTNLDIYLTGSKDDKAISEEVMRNVEISSRIHNVTGNIPFVQWLELMRYSSFVLGNDSGAVHLAAQLGLDVFVIAGYWNYGEFFPYQGVNKVFDIRVSLPKCSGCYSGLEEKCNPMCMATVRNKKVYKCIDDISAETVIDGIKMLHFSKECFG